MLCPRLTSVVVLAIGTIIVIYNLIYSEHGESLKGMVWHLIAGLSFVFVVHREITARRLEGLRKWHKFLLVCFTIFD